MVELINKNSKNVLVCSIYRPPTGKIKPFKNIKRHHVQKSKKQSIYLSGGFNLNILDYETNTKIKHFINLLFQHNFIPLINRPTRITKRTATAIDNIITNSINNSKLTTCVVKTDLTDHFPIFLTSETTVDIYENTTRIFKRNINETTRNQFKYQLNEVNWNSIYEKSTANNAYNSFFGNVFNTLQ